MRSRILCTPAVLVFSCCYVSYPLFFHLFHPPPFPTQVKFTLQHRLKTALFPDLILPIHDQQQKTNGQKVKSLSLDYMISDPTSMEYEEEQERLKLKTKTAKNFAQESR